MARDRQGKNLAPHLRGGLLRALKIIDESNKPLSQRWIDALDKDFIGTMNAAAKLIPKDINIEAEIGVTMNTNALPVDALREAFQAKRNVVAIEDQRAVNDQ